MKGRGEKGGRQGKRNFSLCFDRTETGKLFTVS